MISFIKVLLLEDNISLSGLYCELDNLYIPLQISSACEKSPEIFSLNIFFKGREVFFVNQINQSRH